MPDFVPPTWDDERDVRIMWLWNALNLQVAKGTLTKAGRDQIMRDCFPDKATPHERRGFPGLAGGG
jgi:hypothetical protein